MVCLIYGMGTISSATFLIREADVFQEYTANLFVTTSLAVGFFCITNIIFKINDLFALINTIEKTLDKSKDISDKMHARIKLQNCVNRH